MQQRVQLARALVDPPRLLLLDETTTGLDPSVQADLLEVLARVTSALGSATIVVSHDLAAVRILASRIVVLHHGRIVEQGITEQVLDGSPAPLHPAPCLFEVDMTPTITATGLAKRFSGADVLRDAGFDRPPADISP
jgi:ABC-type phosphonate transport system ATPase subunit